MDESVKPHSGDVSGSVSGDRLSALLDAAVDPIVLIDARGTVTGFNPAAESAFGYAAAEVLGQNVSMLMPPPHRQAHDGYLQRYLRTRQPRIIGIGRETTALRKDGSTFPVELAVGEFRSVGEHGFVGFLRDRSALFQATRQAEELRDKLTHAGRIGILGEMVSSIAHEVNQPLTAIANYASAARRFLLAGNTDPQELAVMLDKIAAQAERAGKVIRGVRSLTRKRNAVRERLDCSALIQEALRLVDFEFRIKGLRIVLQLDPELPAVLGDGVQIQQVLLNLIRNAIEAMGESASGDFVELKAAVQDDWVQISVSDCGPGLDAGAQARLFEPFFSTKPQGMGLGLSICKSIMSAHGGSLEYRHNDQRDGRGGAVFVFILKLAADFFGIW